jgi:predicted lipid-binding transport protein (Tim44 family)
MLGRLTGVALFSIAMAIPAQQTAAQDAIGGAIIGGAAGGLIGGAIGGGRGVVPGIVIGAAAGAIIASEGERRRGGYRYWRNGCYIQRADGSWVAVSPRYCDAPGPAEAVPNDAVAYCMQRYRSYDPSSGTYLGYDGFRHPCP